MHTTTSSTGESAGGVVVFVRLSAFQPFSVSAFQE
jgi:hypothetical protein